mmetsp:Transcript_31260/g.61358  ORF Transcript_31260/g.61358 Transcript_31260/m.61358 type:complete len:206 (-) Transcript_31260:260-877(-)
MPFKLSTSRFHFPSFQQMSPPLPAVKLLNGLAVSRWNPPHWPLTMKWVSSAGLQLSGRSAKGLRPWTSKHRSFRSPCKQTTRVPATLQTCRRTSSTRGIPLPVQKRMALRSMELPTSTSSRPLGPASAVIQPEGCTVRASSLWLRVPISVACRDNAAKRSGCDGRKPAGKRAITIGSGCSSLGRPGPTRTTTPLIVTIGELASSK